MPTCLARLKRLAAQGLVAWEERRSLSHPFKGQGQRGGALDLMVGTQMITKGHHFPGVTLVGVSAADQGLFFPEYRGRGTHLPAPGPGSGTGRPGRIPGKALSQTCPPEHCYVFVTVKEQD